MQIKRFFVQSNLPKELGSLREMGLNIWYSWNWDFVKLLIQLDSYLWEKCHQNPIKMLSLLSQEKLEQASKDNDFLKNLKKVYDSIFFSRIWTRYRTTCLLRWIRYPIRWYIEISLRFGNTHGSSRPSLSLWIFQAIYIIRRLATGTIRGKWLVSYADPARIG